MAKRGKKLGLRDSPQEEMNERDTPMKSGMGPKMGPDAGVGPVGGRMSPMAGPRGPIPRTPAPRMPARGGIRGTAAFKGLMNALGRRR